MQTKKSGDTILSLRFKNALSGNANLMAVGFFEGLINIDGCVLSFLYFVILIIGCVSVFSSSAIEKNYMK